MEQLLAEGLSRSDSETTIKTKPETHFEQQVVTQLVTEQTTVVQQLRTQLAFINQHEETEFQTPSQNFEKEKRKRKRGKKADAVYFDQNEYEEFEAGEHKTQAKHKVKFHREYW
jgi:hypothetical protein